MSADTRVFFKHMQMQWRQVKYLRPHHTTFGDFTYETNTLQHICNVIDSSSLFYGQDLDSLNDQRWIWLRETDLIIL